MTHDIDLAHLRQLLAQGASQRAIAEALGISRSTLQRLLRALKTPVSAPPASVLQQMLRRLEMLETALRRGQTACGDQSPGRQATTDASSNPRLTGDISVRWSVRVPRSMAQHVRTLATVRKRPPSRLVQEALRYWLAGQ
jgi:transcriptional regulator with XRE-family HTH domain